MVHREPLTPEALDNADERVNERAEEGVEEGAVAAFGAWYESQPPEWIAAMDELGLKGPVASGS
jgi:hypothetical protein